MRTLTIRLWLSVPDAGLFGVSAVYHRGGWGAQAAQLLQRLDHTMIVMMIAGSATSALALSAPPHLRTPALLGV